MSERIKTPTLPNNQEQPDEQQQQQQQQSEEANAMLEQLRMQAQAYDQFMAQQRRYSMYYQQTRQQQILAHQAYDYQQMQAMQQYMQYKRLYYQQKAWESQFKRLTSFLDHDNSFLTPWNWNPDAQDRDEPGRMAFQPGSFFSCNLLDKKRDKDEGVSEKSPKHVPEEQCSLQNNVEQALDDHSHGLILTKSNGQL